MDRRRAFALALAVLLLSACSGEPRPGVDARRTAVVGVHAEPDSLNPYTSAGELPIVYELLGPTRTPPYIRQPDGTWTRTELLAEDVELTADPMTLTYRIHPDATWSDGVPITARDFVFAWEVITDPDLEISGRVGVEDISDAEIVDDKTVRFTFARPYAAWRLLFNRGVLPAHVLEGEDFASVWEDGPTVTSGPFRLVEWRRGVHLLLERNPHWWGDEPALEHLRFQVFDSYTTAAQALRASEVDVVTPDYEGFKTLRGRPGIQVATALADSWAMVLFSESVPHHERLAVAHGLDRDALADSSLHEVIDAPRRLDSLVFVGAPTFARYDHDPDRAQAALGDDAAVRLSWLDENAGPLHTNRFEVAQAQLRLVGIDLQADLRELAQYVQGVLEGDFDLFVVRFSGQGDPITLNQLFACHAHLNFTRYCDPEVDELLARALTTLDPASRTNLYLEAEAILADELVVLPLYQMPSVLAWRTELEGPELNPAALSTAWNAASWRFSG